MIVVYWVWRFGMWLTSLVPRRWSLAAAQIMGDGAWLLMSLRRSVAKENFAHVLGKSPDDPEVRRVVRQSFRNYARYLRDVMLYPRTSMADLEQRVVVHTPEHLEQALALNKGAIIVTAHFGNMDLPSAVLAKRFQPITLVGESLRPQALMDYLTQMRAVRNVHLFPYDQAPRKIVSALKRREMTAFLLDFGLSHHFDLSTVHVDFFGSRTDFPAGPARLSLLTGAPIVVGHAHVATDGRIHVGVTAPIMPKASGNRQHDLQATMQEIACRFEDFIRLNPDQWYVFRPMWGDRMISRFKVRKPKYQGHGA